MSNPFAMQKVYEKVDTALDEAISALQREERSAGASAGENATIQKFKSWKQELEMIRDAGRVTSQPHGETGIVQQEGGLFTD